MRVFASFLFAHLVASLLIMYTKNCLPKKITYICAIH